MPTELEIYLIPERLMMIHNKRKVIPHARTNSTTKFGTSFTSFRAQYSHDARTLGMFQVFSQLPPALGPPIGQLFCLPDGGRPLQNRSWREGTLKPNPITHQWCTMTNTYDAVASLPLAQHQVVKSATHNKDFFGRANVVEAKAALNHLPPLLENPKNTFNVFANALEV